MIVYKAVNKINGKVYIGQTVKKLEYRIRQHINWGDGCRAFNRAIKKYGIENFIIDVIDSADSRVSLNEKESYWISFYDCISPKGYNLTSGGQQCKISEESKRRISESRLGDKNWSKRPEVREKKRLQTIGDKNPFYGKKHSDGFKEKLRQRKGELHPCYGLKRPDTAERNRKQTGENNPMFGKKYTEEERKKFGQPGERNAMFGRKRTDEEKAKISAKSKAAWADPEKRERMLLAMVGKKHTKPVSPELRKIRSEYMKRVWAERKAEQCVQC